MNTLECFTCDVTGSEGSLTAINDGNYVCDDCLGPETFECDDCNRRCADDDGRDVPNGQICNLCCSRNYSWCGDCDEYCHDADFDHDMDRCEACSERGVISNSDTRSYDNTAIRNYSFKPSCTHLKTEVDTSTLVGIELEMCYAEDMNSSDFVELANSVLPENMFYYKEDSSLPRRGVEMVTVPTTVGWLNANRDKLSEGLQALIDAGCTTPYQCGTHIHVCKESMILENCRKVQHLFCMDYTKMHTLGGRAPGHTTYVGKLTGDICNKADAGEVRYWCKTNYDTSRGAYALRYHCPTSEIRIFAGNLDPNRVFANIQIADLLRRASAELNMSDMTYDNVLSVAHDNEQHYLDLFRVTEALCAS